MTADSKLAPVTDALARAHHSSRYGSNEARSGTIGDRSAYVSALLARAQDTTRSWTNWEAINDMLAPEASGAKAVMWLNLGAIGGIRKALARDAILGAFQLSDQIQNDRLTICRLADWLKEPGLFDRLSGRQWAIDQGYPPELVQNGANSNKLRLERFRSLVTPDWTKASPEDVKLLELRKRLKPTRDRLAHALYSDISEAPTVDDIRMFIALTLDLATDASFIWIGSAIEADRFRDFARLQAVKFWQHAFAEPISIWEANNNGH